jgi:hypothetical protein
MIRHNNVSTDSWQLQICFNTKQLSESTLVANARLGGTVQLWEWIGDGATTFSY